MSKEAEKELAVIIMGSESDDPYANKVAKVFEDFGVEYVKRVGSAHKSPEHVLDIVIGYDTSGRRIAYVTIAGRSDELSAFVDGATINPVTAAPPYSEKYGGLDVLSSLRVPSRIGSAVAIEPEAAALHTIKIFALDNLRLREALEDYHARSQKKIIEADDAIRKMQK